MGYGQMWFGSDSIMHRCDDAAIRRCDGAVTTQAPFSNDARDTTRTGMARLLRYHWRRADILDIQHPSRADGDRIATCTYTLHTTGPSLH